MLPHGKCGRTTMVRLNSAVSNVSRLVAYRKGQHYWVLSQQDAVGTRPLVALPWVPRPVALF